MTMELEGTDLFGNLVTKAEDYAATITDLGKTLDGIVEWRQEHNSQEFVVLRFEVLRKLLDDLGFHTKEAPDSKLSGFSDRSMYEADYVKLAQEQGLERKEVTGILIPPQIIQEKLRLLGFDTEGIHEDIVTGIGEFVMAEVMSRCSLDELFIRFGTEMGLGESL